jgi:hypothetical protein
MGVFASCLCDGQWVGSGDDNGGVEQQGCIYLNKRVTYGIIICFCGTFCWLSHDIGARRGDIIII